MYSFIDKWDDTLQVHEKNQYRLRREISVVGSNTSH